MSLFTKLKKNAVTIKNDLPAISLALGHPRLPVKAKLVLILTTAYAFSPIDLIPDFIPVLGYLDDLIILPLLMALCIRSIPDEILKECRIAAAEETVEKGKSLFAGLIIILIWIILFFLIIHGITGMIVEKK